MSWSSTTMTRQRFRHDESATVARNDAQSNRHGFVADTTGPYWTMDAHRRVATTSAAKGRAFWKKLMRMSSCRHRLCSAMVWHSCLGIWLLHETLVVQVPIAKHQFGS